MAKMVLRVVGGPHDGALREVSPGTTTVQIAHRVELPKGPATAAIGTDTGDEVAHVNAAVYRRRVFHFEDGQELQFLCWSEFSDYQAMAFLLKVPAQE